MERFISKLKHSEKTVAFTGAGISTLSGVRDFRGANGLYKDPDADKIFDIRVFRKDPAFYYGRTRDVIYNLDEKEPNIVHRELARWEKEGLIEGVITQNIDLLHQKAGIRTVVEVHGTPEIHFCTSCGREYPFSEAVTQLKERPVPLCSCGGVLKPAVTFFGENLPPTAVDKAVEMCSEATLILILGSSLVVQPAASFPLYTLRAGGEMVIVNNQPTPLDGYAALLYSDLEAFFRYTEENL